MSEENALVPTDNPKVSTYSYASHWDTVLDDEFAKESDRAAVILAASMFDNSLRELLKNHLVVCPSSHDELFDGANAPFSTFSAKIGAAFRLGLISSRFSKDLHLIRKIRNEFAHNVHGCDFSDSRVRSRVLELYRGTHHWIKDNYRASRPDGPRGDFVLVCSWMLWTLNCHVEHCDQLKESSLEFGYKPDPEKESNK